MVSLLLWHQRAVVERKIWRSLMAFLFSPQHPLLGPPSIIKIKLSVNTTTDITHFYTPPQNSGGVLCYTLRTVFFSVHPSIYPSIRPSISPSFPDSNLSSFWPIFFKLSKDMDIGVEWFGIANGLNSFINNRVMALDLCKSVFSSISSEQMDEFW